MAGRHAKQHDYSALLEALGPRVQTISGPARRGEVRGAFRCLNGYVKVTVLLDGDSHETNFHAHELGREKL